MSHQACCCTMAAGFSIFLPFFLFLTLLSLSLLYVTLSVPSSLYLSLYLVFVFVFHLPWFLPSAVPFHLVTLTEEWDKSAFTAPWQQNKYFCARSLTCFWFSITCPWPIAQWQITPAVLIKIFLKVSYSMDCYPMCASYFGFIRNETNNYQSHDNMTKTCLLSPAQLLYIHQTNCYWQL